MSTKIDYDAQLSAMKATAAPSEAPKEKISKEERDAQNKELLKKYFNPNLESKESTKKLKFRMLPENNPSVNGPSPIKKVEHHIITYKGAKKTKYVCLKEFGEVCPFCETANALLAKGETEAAKPWRSRPMYIIKGVDRAKESDGVKFWRINHHFKGLGDHDAIQSIIDSKGNISHPETGRDLEISLKRGDDNNQIRNIIQDDVSKLSDDPKIMEILLADTMTWKDVFKPKDAKLMEDMVLGIASYWDESQQKYINPTQENKSSETDTNSTPEEKSNPLMKGEESTPMEYDDDLPF